MFAAFGIDDISEDCHLSSTDLFTIPKTCKDFETNDYEAIPAGTAVVDDSCNQPAEFSYKGTPNKYIDLSSTQIELHAQLLHKDGTILVKDEKVGPVNFLAGALWKNVELYINETLVTAAGSDYSMKSYLQTMLYHNKNAKEGWLTQEMYYEDTPGAMDSVDDSPFNQGLALRQEMCAESKIFDIIFSPKLEMFNQERLLIPSDLRLKMIRQPPEFYIMAKDITKEYKIKILSAKMYIRTVKMSPGYQLRIKTELESKKVCAYPLISTDCTNFLIPYGTSTVTHPISKLGKQPIRIYLALQRNEVMNGKYDKNPYNFEPYNLSEVSFVINGENFPTVPMKMSFLTDDDGKIIGGTFLRAFNELQRTTGVLNMNSGYNIDRSAFPKGFFTLGVLSTESFTDTSLAPPTQGSLVINLTFTKPVPALSAILLLEYQNIITVNGTGSVKKDYTA